MPNNQELFAGAQDRNHHPMQQAHHHPFESVLHLDAMKNMLAKANGNQHKGSSSMKHPAQKKNSRSSDFEIEEWL
eukprot:tig00020554_g10839.t1